MVRTEGTTGASGPNDPQSEQHEPPGESSTGGGTGGGTGASSSDPVVHVLVGRKHARVSVAGTVQRDVCGFVCLSALVKGGDGNVPDKLKRFRLYVCSRGETTKARGCGTFFHPNLLSKFIDKFGDPAMINQNEPARAAIPDYVQYADQVAANQRANRGQGGSGVDDVQSVMHDDVPMSPRTRDLVRLLSKCYHQVFLPEGLSAQEALARLGYVAESSAAATRHQMRNVQRQFHPDRVHRSSRPNGVTLDMMRVVNEEVFKALRRADG